jgi:general secretion pathway protein C
MTIFSNKHTWVFNLLTITVCAFLAAKALGHFVEAKLPREKHQVRAAQAALPPEPPNPRREITSILKRNIFCSSCDPVAALVEEPAADAPPVGDSDDKPVKTSLNLKLIATITSDEGTDNYASILDVTSDKAQIYTIGSKVPGDGVITDILERHVLLRANQRQEYLALEAVEGEGGTSGAPPPPSSARRYRGPEPLPGLEGLGKGIRQVGAVRWEIKRGVISQLMSNQRLLGRGSRVIPVMKDGKPAGFRFFGRKGSVASLLGLYGGDTLKAINGQSITTPERALEVMTKLRTASYLTLTFDRKGEQLTHEYVIR